MSVVPRVGGRRRRALAHVCAAVAGAALLVPGSSSARGVFVTGHDADYHAFLGPSPVGAQHLIQAGIRFATDGKPAPKILVATDVRDPGGGSGDDSDPRNGLIASGYPAFDVADYGSGTPGVLDLHTVDFSAYDVVFVASDEGGWLRQVELDVLNSRRADITRYVNGGGGLVVMPESGLRPPGPGVDPGTSAHRLEFLPVPLASTVDDQLENGFTLTSFGSSLGLTTADINGDGNFAHTYLDSEGPYTTVDRDGEGHIITVAGKGPFCTGGSLALSPADQTVRVGETGTVQGTLTDSCGNPVPQAPVTYTVTSGPDQGATGTGPTDGGGHTTFVVRCSAVGTDTVGATTTAQGGVTSGTVKITCIAPVTMTGRAYGLTAQIKPLGLGVISVAPTPDTGEVSTPASSTTQTPCVLTVRTSLLGADTLCANVTTTTGPPRSSTAQASVQKLTLAALVAGTGIDATAVTSDSTTTCAGSTGHSTFAALKIGATSLVNYRPAPNTTINLGAAKVVLNEQVPVPGGLRVNAIHVTVPLLGTDVVVASSTSDIHNCG